MLFFLILFVVTVYNCNFQQTIYIFDNSTFFKNYEDVDILLSIDTLYQKDCNKIQFYENGTLLRYWVENNCGLKNTLIWIYFDTFYENKTVEMYYDCENGIVTEEEFDGIFYFLTENHEQTTELLNGNFIFGSEEFGILHPQENIHDHVISGENCTSDELKYEILNSNKKFADYQHIHNWNFNSEVNSSTTPPFYDVNILSREKLYMNYSDKPIIIFKTLEDKFSRFVNLDDRLPRLSNSNDDSNSDYRFGGNQEHFHFIDGTLDISNFSPILGNFGGEICSSKQSHVHSVIGQTNTASNYPPFLDVIFGKYTGEQDIINISDSMILISSSIPPLGYELCEDLIGKFPRGSNIYGGTGGSFAHSHNYENIEVDINKNSEQGCITSSQTGLFVSINNHTHNNFFGVSSFVNSHPPYLEALFIKRKTYKIESYYIRVTKSNVENDTVIDHLDNDLSIIELLMIIILSSLFILFLFLIIVIVIIVFCRKKRIYINTSHGRIKLGKNDLKEIAEELIGDDNDQPKFKINKSLFKIPKNDIKLIKQIGKGGSMSKVFKADWKGLIIAFKVFKFKNILETKNNYTEFEKEINILSSINHPSIAQFYGCVLKGSRIGIVMEYCENGELKVYILKSKKFRNFYQLKIKDKLRILIEIASGCEYLHERKIIHRDLKCANLLLDKNLSIKIIDFGISRIVSDKKILLTRAIGTQHYMAPEVIKGRKYDSSCDVYSFSIVMYELLTECFRPYKDSLKGKKDTNIEFLVASNPSFRPEINEKNYPNLEWLIGLMKRCWVEKSSDRPTFSEIKKILNHNKNNYNDALIILKKKKRKRKKKYKI